MQNFSSSSFIKPRYICCQHHYIALTVIPSEHSWLGLEARRPSGLSQWSQVRPLGTGESCSCLCLTNTYENIPRCIFSNLHSWQIIWVGKLFGRKSRRRTKKEKDNLNNRQSEECVRIMDSEFAIYDWKMNSWLYLLFSPCSRLASSRWPATWSPAASRTSTRRWPGRLTDDHEDDYCHSDDDCRSEDVCRSHWWSWWWQLSLWRWLSLWLMITMVTTAILMIVMAVTDKGKHSGEH